MGSSRGSLAFALWLGLLLIPTVSIAQTDYLYVTDYGAGTANPVVGGNMDRYQFTYNSGTNTISNFTPYGAGGNTSNAVFITGAIKEGVQGTHNDIIAVATGGSTLVRYGLDGGLIGTIPVTLGGSSYTLAGIGNIVISPDGRYLYAAESATTQNGLTGGAIDKIQLSTGAIVGQLAFSGAHDLLLVNGVLYAAAYSGSNSGSAGVWTFDENLGSANQMIASNDHGLAAPTGMSMVGNTLYINGNILPTAANSVYEYTVNTSGANPTATYLNSYASTSLNFIFGNAIGPDGNLYIAGLGGASGRSDPGYTDGVYDFNTTTHGVSLLVGGEDGGTTSGPAGSSGLYSPKYLQFSINFVPGNDAGFNDVPEPGAVTFLCSVGFAGAALVRKRSLRTARSARLTR